MVKKMSDMNDVVPQHTRKWWEILHRRLQPHEDRNGGTNELEQVKSFPRWWVISLIIFAVITLTILTVFFILWVIANGNTDESGIIRGSTEDSFITLKPNATLEGDTRMYSSNVITVSNERLAVMSLPELSDRSMAITVIDIMTDMVQKDTSTITSVFDARFDLDKVQISIPESDRHGVLTFQSQSLPFSTIELEIIAGTLIVFVNGVKDVQVEHYINLQIISSP
jgi:hypothetical protein